MSKSEIEMTYGLQSNCNYHGAIWTKADPESQKNYEVNPFSDISFSQMIYMLAEELKRVGEAEVVLSRIEVADSNLVLGKEATELLRKDPEAAVNSMQYPDRVVVVSDKDPVPIRQVLRAGHDSMADTFGDKVYCAYEKGKGIECPFCGRWAHFEQKRMAPLVAILKCGKCSEEYCGTYNFDGKWIILSTVFLLGLSQNRFYLPRQWNKPGPWILRKDLFEKYAVFNEERAKCLEQINGKLE